MTKKLRGKKKKPPAKPAPLAEDRTFIPPELIATLVISAPNGIYSQALVEQAVQVLGDAVEQQTWPLSWGAKQSIIAREDTGGTTDPARVLRSAVDAQILETIDTRKGIVPTAAGPVPFVRLERLPRDVASKLVGTLRTGLRKVKDPEARKGRCYERREVVTAELPEPRYAESRDAADDRTREQVERLRHAKHPAIRRIPDMIVDELADLDLKEEALARALGMTARHLRRLRAELRRR